MIYGVYYTITKDGSRDARIKIGGIYTTLGEAKKCLSRIIPGYRPHDNNTVRKGRYVGWINKFSLDDIDHLDPFNLKTKSKYSVNLFEKKTKKSSLKRLLL